MSGKRFLLIATWLQRHKKITLICFIVFIGLCAARLHSLRLDTSVASLFPDSTASLAKVGELIAFNPGTRVMFVELRAREGESAENLPIAATEIRNALCGLLHQSPPHAAMNPQAWMDIIPQLFDEDMALRLNALMQPEAIKNRMAHLRDELAGPQSFVPKRFVLADPLGFLPALAERMPKAGDLRSYGGTLSDGMTTSPDGRALLLALQPETNINNVRGATVFMNTLDAALEKARQTYPEVEITAAGGLRFTAENSRTIERDLRFTMALSLVFIALIYIFSVRSLGAVWLFLTPVVAVIIAGSVMSWLWPVTAGLALGFGSAVLGLAEDYAVLAHFALRRNPTRKLEALARLLRPMSFSAALCISSFCILMFSGIPALRQLGFFAACSLLCGLIIALFILPCCPWADRPFLKQAPEPMPETQPLRPNLPLTASLVVLCLCVCVFGLFKIPLESSFETLGAGSERLKAELLEIRTRWFSQGAEPAVWASSGQEQDEALAASMRLADNLRASKGSTVNGVFSLSDLLPPSDIRMNNILRWNAFVAKNTTLPSLLDEAAIKQGFKPGAFGGFATWFAKPRSEKMGGVETLRQAGLDDLLWWTLVRHNDAWHVLTFAEAQPDVQTMPESLPDGVLLSSQAVKNGLNAAFSGEKHLLPLAGIICFLLLAICFRKPVLIITAILPPLFGVSSIFAWLMFTGASLTLPCAAAMVLVIGLGADYGIVMLHELASDLSLGAFKSIFVSGLTTLAGLGVLILAEHPVLRTLGGVTFFGLLAEMIAVLLIIPILCHKKQGA